MLQGIYGRSTTFSSTAVILSYSCRDCGDAEDLHHVPIAAVSICSNVRSRTLHYSITSSARASSEGGTVMPSALAVLRLITSSYLVGACTGRLAGFSPLRMRSM